MVLVPLSFCVRSTVVMPSACMMRLRRELEPMVRVLESWDFGKVAGGRFKARYFRIICQMMGKLVQRMPPRGSKTEYAPSGT